MIPCGGPDAWGQPSGKGNSPFSASGSDSDVDVVVDSADVRQSVTDAGSDTSTGGVAKGSRARKRGQFLEDDDDDDSEMDYRNKLAVVEERQVNESDSEFVPSGGEGEAEREAEDNVSVQSFTSGGSSELEAGSADQRNKTVVSRKQGRVIDDDVSCSSGTTGRCCACSCPTVCVASGAVLGGRPWHVRPAALQPHPKGLPQHCHSISGLCELAAQLWCEVR